MGGDRRKQKKRDYVHRGRRGVQDKSRRHDRTKGKEMLRQKVDEEEHLKIHGGLREGIGMKTYLHGPIDYAKILKLRFRMGDLGQPERRKRYNSSRGKARESRINIVAECELYKDCLLYTSPSPRDS